MTVKVVLEKEAVVCGECGEELEAAKYDHTMFCDHCGVNMNELPSPAPAIIVTLRSPPDDMQSYSHKFETLHFDRVECLAEYLRGLTHSNYSIDFPWLSVGTLNRLARAIVRQA